VEVLTVTMNPALDREIAIDNFELNKLHRIFDPSRYFMSPGGKGINVSMALANFGIESIATGVLGGYIGRIVEEELRAYSNLITTNFIHVDGETRENITIVDDLNGTITEINAPGPQVDERALEDFLRRYKMGLSRVKIVVISGTVPPGVPLDFYSLLVSMAKEKGKMVIMEARGQLLKNSVYSSCPDIVKPDMRAENRCLGRDLKVVNDYIEATREILKYGAKLSVISYEYVKDVIGTKDGVWMIETEEDVSKAHLLGTGDTYVAGMVYYLLRKGDDMLGAAEFGYAAALAKTKYLKKVFPKLEEIEKARKTLKIERLL